MCGAFFLMLFSLFFSVFFFFFSISSGGVDHGGLSQFKVGWWGDIISQSILIGRKG